MQAVLLAAGMGKRLGALTRNSTKCMVPVNGRPLVEHTFEALAAAGVGRAVVVTGHGAEELRGLLGASFRGVSVEYVHNPDYAKTNNIYSLFLARAAMERDDSILLESDVLFEPSLAADLLAHPAADVAVVARFKTWMDGTVTKLDELGFISCFLSKKEMDWAELDHYYKTVNIYKLSRGFCRDKFFPFLEAYIRAKGLNEYYEEVLKVLTLIDRGSLQALEMGDRVWYEIDDLQDLDIAEALFSRGPEKLRALHARYGGYWRFPALKDFCYLVNPYFPSPRMLQEMGRDYPALLMSYPSGQKIQNLLAAKVFGVAPGQVLVGNGASELIKALFREWDGPLGLSVPTFDEYRACAGRDRVKVFRPSGRDFRYGAGELLEFARAEGLSALVLINPDNPTGNLIPLPEVVRLAEGLRESGIRLIYDESFADFVDGGPGPSLITPEFLERFPNVAAIKSISKSYGVPGLRLGILATADPALLERVWRHVSIWNVNSPAEHFLQIVDKYRADFRAACRSIAAERERLAAGLAEIPFLRPLPSAANYILCEVLAPWTPARLAEALLDRHWIFVKDCTGKIGFERTPCVRLTVRDRNDDDILLAALGKLAP